MFEKKENTGIYFPAQKYLPPKNPPLDLTTNKYSAFLYFVFWQQVQSNFTLIYPNLLTFTQSKPYSVRLRWVQRELQTWKPNNSTKKKKSNFPICFIYVTHAFRQGTYLQASGGPFVEEHLIPNRTPLIILNGMEILEILNNSTWATRVTLDEAENNNLTNVIMPTIAIWQLKLRNLPVAESHKWI